MNDDPDPFCAPSPSEPQPIPKQRHNPTFTIFQATGSVAQQGQFQDTVQPQIVYQTLVPTHAQMVQGPLLLGQYPANSAPSLQYLAPGQSCTPLPYAQYQSPQYPHPYPHPYQNNPLHHLPLILQSPTTQAIPAQGQGMQGRGQGMHRQGQGGQGQGMHREEQGGQGQGMQGQGQGMGQHLTMNWDSPTADEEEQVGKSKRGRSNSQMGPATKKQKTSLNRKDNSLNKLTARFMDMIQSSASGTVDLNQASAQLQVQKRRIYDITNVLEGIGLIVKKSKNNIVWSGGTVSTTEFQEQVAKLREEIIQMREEELFLDQKIKDTQDNLKNILDSNPQTTFVTYDDIRSLAGMNDQTIIAIRAQTGTKLEVPDPDCAGNPRRYQIFLKGEHPIDVYLVSQLEDDDSQLVSYPYDTPPLPPPPVTFTPGLGLESKGMMGDTFDYFLGSVEVGSISEFYGDETV